MLATTVIQQHVEILYLHIQASRGRESKWAYTLLTQMGDNILGMPGVWPGEHCKRSGRKTKLIEKLWASSETAVLEDYGASINSSALQLYFQNHLSISNLTEKSYTSTSVLGHLQDQNAETKWCDLFLVCYCTMISVLGIRSEGKLAHSKCSMYIFHAVLSSIYV